MNLSKTKQKKKKHCLIDRVKFGPISAITAIQSMTHNYIRQFCKFFCCLVALSSFGSISNVMQLFHFTVHPFLRDLIVFSSASTFTVLYNRFHFGSPQEKERGRVRRHRFWSLFFSLDFFFFTLIYCPYLLTVERVPLIIKCIGIIVHSVFVD